MQAQPSPGALQAHHAKLGGTFTVMDATRHPARASCAVVVVVVFISCSPSFSRNFPAPAPLHSVLIMPSPPSAASAPTPEATFNPISLTTTPPIQTPITFLFHITIVLLSLAALYVLSTVPRALAALGQPQSVVLRSVPAAHRRSPSSSSSGSASRRRHGNASGHGPGMNASPTAYPRKAAEPLHREASGHSARTLASATDESHTLHSHAQLILPRAGSGGRSRGAGRVKYSPPTRVPHWATLVHPLLAALLAWRVTPRLSVAQVGVLGTYAGVWAYGGLYR
ncbi:hypothetical protein EVG20_g10677, partial [Dentipellis fragilis]